jgi:hypothetical protein
MSEYQEVLEFATVKHELIGKSGKATRNESNRSDENYEPGPNAA